MDYISKTLEEILEGIDFNILTEECKEKIHDIKTDSRIITKSDMFVALKGQKYDGHTFMNEAYKNGATYIVINQEMESTICPTDYKGATIISILNTRVCLPHIINNFYSHPSRHFTLIGVTGTNGKTSVITTAKHVLRKLHNKVGLIGTINNYIDDEILTIEKTTPTTPDCTTLGMIMNKFVTNQVNIALMEVSSMALKNHRVDGQHFDIAVFTNLSPEHLDDHKTMGDYLNSKLMLFDKAKQAVINIDNTYSKVFLEKCQGKTIKYGIKNSDQCDIYATELEYSTKGMNYTLVHNNKTYKATASTPSEFAVYNHLAVIGICLLLELDIEKVITFLSDDIQIEGRYEVIKRSNQCSVIIDYAHTPVALENLLLSVRKNSGYKRIITVFGCGGDRDKGKRSAMGKISQTLSDISIITSDNPRTENPIDIINDITENLSVDAGNYFTIPDRKAAIEYGIQLANEDDVVVIAGKGHEKQQIFNEYTIEFDDKKIAEAALQL